ncbi:MAG: ABC transporter ATP-binding protein [Gemmatimonadaceae bacterium]|nr:ABC transporter ATP-binding protein [Gemmatimonadaceae bacterium]
MDAILTLAGVHKRYGRTIALADVSATIARGRTTALIGPNGSGKTTLNRVLLGFVRPDAGDVRLDGVSLLHSHAARAAIGYMPQLPRYPDHLSARDLVALLRGLRAGAPVDDTLFDALEVRALLDTPLGVLSGGQRQRVNAALALLFRPALAVLDEPTAGLDPRSAQRLKAVLRARVAEGASLLVTSHVLSELEALADDVLFLLEGRVAFAGPVDVLRAQARDGSLESAIAALMEGAPLAGVSSR